MLFLLPLLAATVGTISAPTANITTATFGAPPPGSPTAFSDDFNRASSDTLGANWVEDLGDTDIVSDTVASLQTASYSRVANRWTETTSTSSQYHKLTFPTFVSENYPELLLRMNGSDNPHYAISFSVTENTVAWGRYTSSVDTASDEIASASLTVDAGDTFGVTVTGTGNDTVVRVWRNPTGLALAADSWNGDTTPDVTFTTDPGANAVDTGNQVGFGGYVGLADQVKVDDFAAGDIP